MRRFHNIFLGFQMGIYFGNFMKSGFAIERLSHASSSNIHKHTKPTREKEIGRSINHMHQTNYPPLVFHSGWIESIRKCLFGHHRSRVIHMSYTSSCKNIANVSSLFASFNLWKLSTSFFHTNKDPRLPSK